MPSDVRSKTPGSTNRQKQTDPEESWDLALRANMAHLKRYARGLLRNAADADDLVQDCLTRMLARESGRGPVREQRRFLIVSARNLFFTRYKQRVRRSVTLSLSDLVDELGYAPTQQDRLNLRDVARGLARLPPAQREAIILVALDELSCEQAARSLGVAVGTIQSRVHRARMALKSLEGTPKPIPSRKPQRGRRTIAAYPPCQIWVEVKNAWSPEKPWTWRRSFLVKVGLPPSASAGVADRRVTRSS